MKCCFSGLDGGMRRNPLAKGHWAFTPLALCFLSTLQLGFSYMEGFETSLLYLERFM